MGAGLLIWRGGPGYRIIKGTNQREYKGDREIHSLPIAWLYYYDRLTRLHNFMHDPMSFLVLALMHKLCFWMSLYMCAVRETSIWKCVLAW